MEKVSFRNSQGLNLAGYLFRGGSDKIVIMAHGFASDKLSHGKTERVASALNENGYDALAFDFGGCGESDDDVITADNEVEDLKGVLEFARSEKYKRFALYGHSLGSLICLKAYRPEIETMVLTGALTGPMYYRWSDYYSEQQLRDLEARGYLADESDSQWRREVKIGKEMLHYFERIDQRELLTKVKCPVLIIQGNREDDEEELVLLENSKKGLPLLPEGSRLEIIDGAGHRLQENFDRVVSLVCDWYKKYF
ncbi:conserved hypothetical protein [Candidatus Zixiibacteriota bacterium]|nr:conserved hypothetical protein [candidate division Zixibacteria bacterium]